MADLGHLERLGQGIEAWNAWRGTNSETVPDLSGAHLRRLDFSGSSFVRADLRNVNLSGADLEEAHLLGADLRGADLGGARLWGTHLYMTRLNGADLTGANLGYATLRWTNLEGADLAGAVLVGTVFAASVLDGARFHRAHCQRTVFADVDLSSAVGLETIEHVGPSSLSIDTLYRSHGMIPEAFLRGVGLPDTMIDYARSLVARPVDFYSSFISHSRRDRRFCDRLYADLQASGVRTWYFPEDARWGEPVWGEIDRGIALYDKLVVVCSRHSLQSGPVQREIERALQREDREGKNVLFPLRLDDYLFGDWAHPRKADVVAKVAGDFRGWSRSSGRYQAALGRLIAALKAE